VRVVHVVALMAVVTAVAPVSEQAPQAATSRGAGTRAGGGRPTVTAVRAVEAPAIDGRLDDAIWRNAALIDTFVQEEPLEGAAATEQTEVRVAYDSEKVYFGIYAH
jgi:hypothetical protein